MILNGVHHRQSPSDYTNRCIQNTWNFCVESCVYFDDEWVYLVVDLNMSVSHKHCIYKMLGVSMSISKEERFRIFKKIVRDRNEESLV